MDKEKRTERMLPRVKKTVDSVYEYLIPHPDGCGMAAKDFGKTNSRIITSLVSRKIIEKTNLGKGEYKYRWAATMGPTPTLYRSIALEIQTESREYYETHKKKQKKEKESPALDAPVDLGLDIPALESVAEKRDPLEEVQELWTRMRELGVTIENNQLVLVTKTILV